MKFGDVENVGEFGCVLILCVNPATRRCERRGSRDVEILQFIQRHVNVVKFITLGEDCCIHCGAETLAPIVNRLRLNRSRPL